MVFTTEGLFEVAIESWPEWDLNPRPLNSVQMLIVCSVSNFISAIAFVSRHVCLN